MYHETSLLNRRSFLHEGLLALAAVFPMHALLVEDAAAEKKKKKKTKSVAERAQTFVDGCFNDGGEPDVSVRPGGTTVSCEKSGGGSYACTITSKSSRCFATMAHSDQPGFAPVRPTVDPGDAPDVPLEPDAQTSDPGDVPTVPLEPVSNLRSSVSGASAYRRRRSRRHHR